MNELPDEVYREKYLKYKKKYLTMLENMKGGLTNQPLTQKSKVYFCVKETYESLQKSGRVDNLMIKGVDTNDECFLERMKLPNVSLVLEDGKLKVVGGAVQNIPNYPFLYGRKFGIKEESNDKRNFFGKTGIKELPFNNEFAIMQLKNAEPIIKKILENFNNNFVNEVYFLHTTDKQVSYNGVLEYSEFPSFSQFVTNPNIFNNNDVQKGGMGDIIFYFCNPASSLAINSHYFKNSDSPVKANEKCMNDIALDKLLDKDLPKFGYIKAKDDGLYILNDRNLSKTTRLVIPMKLGEKTDVNTKKKWWSSNKITVYSEDNIREQLPSILNGDVLTLLGVRNDDEISIYKLHGGLLSKFSKSSQNVSSSYTPTPPPKTRTSSPPSRPPPPRPQSGDRFPTSESDLFDD